MQDIKSSFDNILRNIVLSHVVVREIPGNNNNKTLVRIHLIPLNSKNHKYDNVNNSVLYPKNVIKQKRNIHVSHLPKYKKITNNNIYECPITKKHLRCNICSICQNDFIKGEYIRELPICQHIYHKKCIDKWFSKDLKNMRCPICRECHTKEKLQERGKLQEHRKLHI
jgi:hypothetical protein